MGMQCRKPGEQERLEVKCFKKTLFSTGRTQDPAWTRQSNQALGCVNFGTNAEKASGPPRFIPGVRVLVPVPLKQDK